MRDDHCCQIFLCHSLQVSSLHILFLVSVKSYKVTMPKCLRPSAEQVSACGRRNEAPRRTQEKTSGSQGKALGSFFNIWFGFLCAQVS